MACGGAKGETLGHLCSDFSSFQILRVIYDHLQIPFWGHSEISRVTERYPTKKRAQPFVGVPQLLDVPSDIPYLLGYKTEFSSF